MNGLPWIRIYTTLPDDGRSLLLGALLGNPDAYLHMVALRLWMGRRAPDGIVRGELAEQLVETAAAWRGTPGQFLKAALKAGFLAEVVEYDEVAPDTVVGYADVSWPEEQAAHVAKLERDRERARLKAEEERARRESEANKDGVRGEIRHEAGARSPRGRRAIATSDQVVGTKTTHGDAGTGEARGLRVESREGRVEASPATQGAQEAPFPVALRVDSVKPEGVDPELDEYIENALQEDEPRRPAIQPTLVEVPSTPPRTPRTASRPPAAPRTTPEEREARDRVLATCEEVNGKPYDWRGEDWNALRKCLEPSCSGGDLDLLDSLLRHALALGAAWPGCTRLRELASKWDAVLKSYEQAAGGTRNARAERQSLGGDVPRVPGMVSLYTGSQR